MNISKQDFPVLTFDLDENELSTASPYELQVAAICATPSHKGNTFMHQNRSRFEREASNEELSAVEYIFEQLTEQPRQWSDGPELNVYNESDARMCITAGGWDERLMCFASDDLSPGWQLAQLAQTIAVTMAEMLNVGQFVNVITACKQWKISILHDSLAFSPEEMAHVHTALELLQGVQNAAQAAKKNPVLWWEGKKGNVTDPRRATPGKWVQTTNAAGRRYDVRRISTLAIEVKDIALGTSENHCADSLKGNLKRVA